ncbi:acyl-CoA dehydrogenase family protein [Streptomyces roseifaciens]|uniref:acyl-CoA dehydrogenase family protein n=1 Tax=Streptomyces roseifaciens TaxID=1488406 RepID=UPI0007181E0E|nr:acyl-CoA dehydrogenase [Streptomyces roseifaciens]
MSHDDSVSSRHSMSSRRSAVSGGPLGSYAPAVSHSPTTSRIPATSYGLATTYDSVIALDAFLDRPWAGETPFARAELSALDRREAFPATACAALDSFGLCSFYVDVRHGGRMRDMAELVQLQRTVARRDLTVAVAHGKTFLGAAPVWVAGAHEQASRLARAVRSGGVVSWALTERDHGSDLLAGELTARPCEGGWRLDGEKWLINNATRGRYLCVLARTADAGGPRGFSLLLVDKTRLAPGSYRTLPKVRTHGIRGADISGIVFDGAVVPGTALVGESGAGVETVLTSLQLTRTLCTSLSLGALDHGLDIAVRYARSRVLYGRTLAELPRVRRILGRAAATLAVAESVVDVAARSIHTLTSELSVVSAVTKALVPSLVQDSLDTLAELLGVRGFLSESYADGAFAKLERDHRIVAVFDGSTAVNRSLLVDHFPALSRAWRKGTADRDAVARTVPGAPVLPFDPARLRMLSTRGCSLVQLLPEAAGRLRRAAGEGLVPWEASRAADELVAFADALHTGLGEQKRAPRTVPQAAFDLAEQYELCFAGAALIHLYLAGAGTPHDVLRLSAGLALVLNRLGHPLGEARAEAFDHLADRLLCERQPPQADGAPAPARPEATGTPPASGGTPPAPPRRGPVRRGVS